MPLDGYDLAVKTLGPCRRESPLAESALRSAAARTTGSTRATGSCSTTRRRWPRARGVHVDELPGFEAGGPRRQIFFDPSKTRVGIVTCGGLCPGLNNVIRGLVMELTRHYGVQPDRRVPQRLPGLHRPLRASRDGADAGGRARTSTRTAARSSAARAGSQDPEEIVDCLEQLGINILFVIGGDGSLHGAQAIADVVAERDLRIAIVGVPKTIDNDIPFIDHSFGFRTAFSRATESIRAAHIEARSAPGGVGLVKLMGRHSGFIACYAALAKNDADYVLIPEVPFELDGEHGFLAHLRRTVQERGHAVIIVAEGAGQEYLADEPAAADASGNARLHDIQRLLQQRITDDFAANGLELNLKLLDPSYAIRSVPANPYDSVYCVRLAHAAVHAAMAGRTEVVVGRWHGRFVHIPIPVADQPPQHGRPRRRPVALGARVDRPAGAVRAAAGRAGGGVAGRYGTAGSTSTGPSPSGQRIEVDRRGIGAMDGREALGEPVHRLEEVDALGPVVRRDDDLRPDLLDDRHRLRRPDRRPVADGDEQQVDLPERRELRVAQRGLAEVAEVRDAHPSEGEDEERVRPALRAGDLVVLGRDADDLADRRLVGPRQRPEHHRVAADRADAVVVASARG